MDLDIRELERKVAAGDIEAVPQLAAARARSGIGFLEAEYLHAYIKIIDNMFSKVKWYNENGGSPQIASQALKDLNELFTRLGIDPRFLRKELIGRDAAEFSGAWYVSSADC